MTDLTLSEGHEFFIGGQRYVIKDGVPVQEAKRVVLVVDSIDHGDSKPLSVHGSDGWIDEDIQIEVLD